MNAARAWLPPGALAPAVAAALAAPLSAWSTRWLPEGARLATVTGGGRAVAPAAAGEMRRRGSLVEVVVRPSSRVELLRAMLRLEPDDAALGDVDRQLLDLFSERALDDLLALIEEGAPQELSDGPARAIPLQFAAGREAFVLRCPETFLTHMIRRGHAKPPSGGALKPRWTALARSEVTLTARLGHAALSLDELRGLAVGDILVMDHPLAAPMEVVLASSGRTVSLARLGTDHGERVLQF